MSDRLKQQHRLWFYISTTTKTTTHGKVDNSERWFDRFTKSQLWFKWPWSVFDTKRNVPSFLPKTHAHSCSFLTASDYPAKILTFHGRRQGVSTDLIKISSLIMASDAGGRFPFSEMRFGLRPGWWRRLKSIPTGLSTVRVGFLNTRRTLINSLNPLEKNIPNGVSPVVLWRKGSCLSFFELILWLTLSSQCLLIIGILPGCHFIPKKSIRLSAHHWNFRSENKVLRSKSSCKTTLLPSTRGQ